MGGYLSLHREQVAVPLPPQREAREACANNAVTCYKSRISGEQCSPLRVCAKSEVCAQGCVGRGLRASGADPYVRVIPSEPIKASRGISTERRTRGRGVNTPSFPLQNVTLRHWIATFLFRSHCGVRRLAVCLFVPCGTQLAKLRCPRLVASTRHTFPLGRGTS